MPLIGQPTETETAQPIRPVQVGVPGVRPSIYPIFQVKEAPTAQAITPLAQGAATVGIKQPEATELAQAITPLAQGAATVVVGQASSVNAAQAITPHQVPATVVKATAPVLPASGTPATVAVARDTTGLVLQLQVVDQAGAGVDLAFATAVVVVFRTPRGRWEVTPSTADAAGRLVVAVPAAALHRTDWTDYQVRADYVTTGRRLTRTGRIQVLARL
jgi:hypothetical protein